MKDLLKGLLDMVIKTKDPVEPEKKKVSKSKIGVAIIVAVLSIFEIVAKLDLGFWGKEIAEAIDDPQPECPSRQIDIAVPIKGS